MKLLAVLTFATAALAAAAPDAELVKRGCTKNNCLRAMIDRPAAATTFCATYTTAVSTGVGQFTQCDNAAKATTACSCLYPTNTPCLANGDRCSVGGDACCSGVCDPFEGSAGWCVPATGCIRNGGNCEGGGCCSPLTCNGGGTCSSPF